MRSFRFPSTRSIPLHEREETSGTQGRVNQEFTQKLEIACPRGMSSVKD